MRFGLLNFVCYVAVMELRTYHVQCLFVESITYWFDFYVRCTGI